MTDPRDPRSVRVELDGDADLSSDAPAIAVNTAGSKINLAALFATVGLLAALVFGVSQLDDDATGGAEDAEDETSAPPASSSGELDEQTFGGLANSDATETTKLFQRTVGAGQLESVVRSPSGFLGLMSNPNAENALAIVHTEDGVEWNDLTLSFDESVPVAPIDRFTRVFEKLIVTETGYALLMTTSEPESDGNRSPAVRVLRLVSPDAMAWSVDANFAPFESNGQFTRIVAHGADTFVVSNRSSTTRNEDLLQRLETQLGDDSLEPDQLAELVECTDALGGRSNESSVWVTRSGAPAAELEGATALLFAPLITEDGRIVAIDFPSSPAPSQRACEPFIDLADRASSAIVVWAQQSPNRPVRHAIPAEVDVASLLSVGAEPVISGSELLLLVGTGLTQVDLVSVDLDSGAWEQLFTLPVRPDDETSVRLTADGSQLVYLDSARATVVGLRTQQVRFAESEAGNRPGFPQIIYVDDEIAFARGANSVFRVDLPLQ